MSNYSDSTHYRDSLCLFTIVIVDCLTIQTVILIYEFVWNTCKFEQQKLYEMHA